MLRHVPDNVFMTQVIETMVSPNSWPMGGLLGTLPACVTSELKKPAHGRIFGDFFCEPAQGRIFEWALLRGLPVQYEDRLKKLKLPSLIYRRERWDMIETYKYTDNSWLILAADSNTRGHSLKLTKQRSMTELRRHYFSNRIVNNWNSLSDHVVLRRGSRNLFFKASLDKLWKKLHV